MAGARRSLSRLIAFYLATLLLVGVVVVAVVLFGLDPPSSSLRWVAVGGLVSLIGISGAFALALQHRMVRPAVRLRTAVAALGEGSDGERVTPEGAVEIAGLAHAFNAAAERAEEAEASLESRLQRLAARDHAIVTSLGDGLVVLDTDRRITRINEQASRILSKSEGELLGRHWPECVEDRTGTPVPLADWPSVLARETGEMVRSPAGRPHLLRQPESDTPLPVAITATPLLDGENVDGVVVLLRDMSQEQKAHEELERFAYVAAHDLKEPLRKILAFGGRLEQATAGILDEKSVGYLQRMQGAAARLEQLVESLLAFTRVSTRGRPFEAVDLEQVVDQVCGDFEESIAESDCQILYSELPTVHADPHQVRQLLQNLVGNALKYRRPDERPVIMIRAEDISADDQAFCRIEVTDNGIGFDVDYAERIFVIFERLHARSEIPGTGIGLAVCRRIVERHGGTITAEGRPGRGATFRFTLPAGPAVPDGVAGESGDRRAPARRGVVRLLRHHGRDQTSTSPSADGAAKTWEGTR